MRDRITQIVSVSSARTALMVAGFRSNRFISPSGSSAYRSCALGEVCKARRNAASLDASVTFVVFFGILSRQVVRL